MYTAFQKVKAMLYFGDIFKTKKYLKVIIIVKCSLLETSLRVMLWSRSANEFEWEELKMSFPLFQNDKATRLDLLPILTWLIAIYGNDVTLDRVN